MLQLTQPPEFKPTADKKKAWKKWRRDFEIFLSASGAVDKLSEEGKINLLLHVIGTDGRDAYEAFDWPSVEIKTLDAVFRKFDAYYIPLVNEAIETHVFNLRVQRNDETIDHYLEDLKRLSESCEFGDKKDKMLRDRLLSGVFDDKLREKLLNSEERPLTLNKAIEICKVYEVTKQHLKTLREEKTEESTSEPTSVNVASERHHQGNPRGYQRRSCLKFGKQHDYGKCPAFGVLCNVCKRKNHFENLCRLNDSFNQNRFKFRNNDRVRYGNSTTNENNSRSDSYRGNYSSRTNFNKRRENNDRRGDSYGYRNSRYNSDRRESRYDDRRGIRRDKEREEYTKKKKEVTPERSSDRRTDHQPRIRQVDSDCNGIRAVKVDYNFCGRVQAGDVNNVSDKNFDIGNMNSSGKDYYWEKLNINGNEIDIRLDSGADKNVMPVSVFKKLGLSKDLIEPSQVRLFNFDGSAIEVLGKCNHRKNI